MKARDWIVCGLALAMVLSVGTMAPVHAQQAAAPGQQSAAAAGVPVAGQTSGVRIAIINGDRVVNESNIGVQMQEETRAAATDWETRVRAKQEELDGLVAQAQAQRLTLTEEALANIQAQVEQLQVDLERLNADAQRALTRMADEAQTRINAVLIPAVERLANEDGYDLILDTRAQGLLYFADAIDVTDRYLALVNADYPLAQQDELR